LNKRHAVTYNTRIWWETKAIRNVPLADGDTSRIPLFSFILVYARRNYFGLLRNTRWLMCSFI